jgi:hypothetical protein
VIVVDLFGRSRAADGAQAALLPNELVNLVSANPIAPAEVIVARATVAFLDESPVSRVVAWLAITVVTGLAAFVARKLRDWFGVTTGCACEAERRWGLGSHDMALSPSSYGSDGVRG